LKYYLQCKRRFEVEYGGVLPYIIKERLQWKPAKDGTIQPIDPDFLGNKLDIKILCNDFPYGVEEGIIHVVVWSKAKIPIASPDGDITDESRQQIDVYIKKTFEEYLGLSRDDILWFKNWAALQSVRALDHFHVLLNRPSKEKLDKLIGTPGMF
jgi:hypothetical protein